MKKWTLALTLTSLLAKEAFALSVVPGTTPLTPFPLVPRRVDIPMPRNGPHPLDPQANIVAAAVGGALAAYVAEKAVEATFKMARSESVHPDFREFAFSDERLFDLGEGFASPGASRRGALSEKEVDTILLGLEQAERQVALIQEMQIAPGLRPESVGLIKDFNRLAPQDRRDVIRTGRLPDGAEANFMMAIAAGAAAGAAIGVAKEVVRWASGDDRIQIPSFDDRNFDLSIQTLR